MATATTLVPLETYLTTSYEHDREWVDGELRERGTPDEYHSAIQTFFIKFFGNREELLGVRVRTELRLQVAFNTYRIPDVTLLREDAPFTPVATEAPLLCIEVLSPDDRASELQEKIAEYLEMGAGAIWVIDPRRRTMAFADAEGMHYVRQFVWLGADLTLSDTEVFAEINKLEARRLRDK